MLKSPQRSPLGSPLDLERVEDALRQIEVVPVALWPSWLRAEWCRLVEKAGRQLLDLHALGRIKLTRSADGRLEAEVLDRELH